MSKYTRRGKAALMAQTPRSGVSIDKKKTGAITVTVDPLRFPIPEKSYRASTASHYVSGSEFIINFAQFKVASSKRLQSAIAMIMPRWAVRTIKLNDEIIARINTMALEAPPLPFPDDQDRGEDYQSITYEAQTFRMMINERLGCAIDFFQIPIEPLQSKNVQTHPIIRVTMSPSLFAMVSQWVLKEINQ